MRIAGLKAALTETPSKEFPNDRADPWRHDAGVLPRFRSEPQPARGDRAGDIVGMAYPFLLIHESPLTDALFLLVSKSDEVTTT